MSRTIRNSRERFWKNGRKLDKVPDGKQAYNCRCAWCMSLDKQKAYERIAKQEATQKD